jgi:hypothetical protein
MNLWIGACVVFGMCALTTLSLGACAGGGGGEGGAEDAGAGGGSTTKAGATTGSTHAATSTGGGVTCPSTGYMTCTSDADCCSGTCAKNTTSSKSLHCTLSCVDDSDCASTKTWKRNPNSGFGCNAQTGYCF